MRRWWLISQAALFGVIGVLVFPGASLALRPTYFISLSSTGASPSSLTMPAGLGHILFFNSDTVTHTVTFASGCAFDVAPGANAQCPDGWNVVGDYDYTVDGTAPASLTITPEGRRVTIKLPRHGFRMGSRVRLQGTLAIAPLSPPPIFGPRMPVTVFVRPDADHPWRRIAVVTSEPQKKPHIPAVSVWHLWVRLRAHTGYMVQATSQPKAGQYWENAQSGPFGLYVRH